MLLLNRILYNQKNFLKRQENFLLKLAPYMLSPDVWEKIKIDYGKFVKYCYEG